MTSATCRPHPTIRLPTADGGTVDLDDFRTQKLVVFVCPHKDHEASAKEISDYEALLPDFAQAGVWVVGIAAAPGQIREVPRHMRLALDCDGAALLDLADWARIEPRPTDGTTFVLERDGGLRSAWGGCGRARDALEMAREAP